jgi:methionyl-tRNA synthetase
MSRYYITTPIYYVSDPPHIGHAYTTIVADAIARYHRMRGDTTHFLTGTDEHGQKVARIAEERGKTTQAYVDEIAQRYKDAWKRLAITNDDFIRTTDADHEAVVQSLWRKLEAQGDIYLADYEGPYCVSCEQFYTEKELVDGLCPVHHRPVEIVKESSFYFRLSKYKERLLAWYAEAKAVRPQIRMNEVRTFVEGELRDISVSRTTFTWGIPVPDHPGHVVYVWIDALVNYYSATRRKGPTHGVDFWSPGTEIVHVLGKEISRFHAVFWPALLMALDLPLPSSVFCHGWWTVDGEKMSKTQGNVVDPLKLADDLGADAVRYFVLREVPLGLDGDFSHEALLQRFNSELANDLGNLLNRTLGMVHKYFAEGSVPARAGARDPVDTAARIENWSKHWQEMQPSRALEEVFVLVRAANAYIDQSAPWKADSDRPTILGNVLETCRIIAQLISPVMPERARALLTQLGSELANEAFTIPRWEGTRSFSPLVGTPLFPRLDDVHRQALLEKWRPQPVAQPAPILPEAKEHARAGRIAAATAAVENETHITYDDFARLELRVAEVMAAEPVPKAKKLLKLDVSLGALGKRQVVAGIAEAYEPAALVGKRVILVCNLAPATIRGVRSEGMILAAGDDAILGLSTVDPTSIAPGTRIR